MTRVYHCLTCREKRNEPVYCAPLRCLCGHRACPAYHSYIPLREDTRGPVTVRTTTNTTWDDRTHATWIDNL